MKILYIILTLLIISYAQELSVESNKSKESLLQFDDNNDSLNFCLAIAEKDLTYCSKIKNKDEKSSCFGILKRNSGYCIMVVDQDIQNSCLAIALSDIKYCEKIKDKKKKSSCKLSYKEYQSEKNKDECINNKTK